MFANGLITVLIISGLIIRPARRVAEALVLGRTLWLMTWVIERVEARRVPLALSPPLCGTW